METLKIKTDDGKEFSYNIDKNPNLSGYSIATFPINEEIVSELKIIKEIDIKNLILSKKEANDLNVCNMSIKELVGKYYDGNGFVYYETSNQVYRFYLKINYLKKLYKNKINGT